MMSNVMIYLDDACDYANDHHYYDYDSVTKKSHLCPQFMTNGFAASDDKAK